MRTIFFKKILVEKIVSKQKTTTIRQWKSCSLKPNDIICCNFKPPLLQINNIQYKQLQDLTIEEIQKDGFDSQEEFILTYCQIYGKYTPSKMIYVISFHLYTPNS